MSTVLFHEPKSVVYTKHKDERMKFYSTVPYAEAKERWRQGRHENQPVELDRIQGMGNQPIDITLDHSMITIIEPYS